MRVAVLLALAGCGGAPVVLPTTPFAQVSDGKGEIFADQAGGTVRMDVEGAQAIDLNDGEVVQFEEDDAAAGSESDTTAKIITRAVEGRVPNARLVLETRLHRSPDKAFAVYSAIAACGDVCHAEIWIVNAAGRRVQLTVNGSPDTVVAWRADHKEVAIGGGGLWLVSLPDLRFAAVDEATSPAYAPDGTLYARGFHGEVLRVTGSHTAVIAPAKKDTRDPDAPEPAPVHFDEHGAPKWE